MIGNGYVVPKDMREYNFPVRNFDGTFYKQVYPFDPFHFSTQVRPTGALLFTPHHSQLTLLQHIILHAQMRKSLCLFYPRYPNTGWRMMAPWDCRTATAGIRFVALSLSLARSRRTWCTSFQHGSGLCPNGWTLVD